MDQEIHREIVQGVLDDPKIPRGWVDTALEGARYFSSLTTLIIYGLATRCHNKPHIVLIPTTRVQHQIETKIQTLKIDLNIIMDHVKSLENKIRQESEQLEINRVKHESDLRNMSQKYES